MNIDGAPIQGQTVIHWGVNALSLGLIIADCGLESRDLSVFRPAELSGGDRVCARCRWPEELARWIEADPAYARHGLRRLYYRPRPMIVDDGA